MRPIHLPERLDRLLSHSPHRACARLLRFNILVFSLEDITQQTAAIDLLQAMESAARAYVAKSEGWSDNLGMFFQVYGWCSVCRALDLGDGHLT